MLRTILISFSLIMLIPQKNALAQLGEVVIKIDGIENENGTLMIGLFNEDDKFLKIPSFPKEVEITTVKSIVITMDSIPYGLYAISIYHDLNGNKELDSNFIKIPKEPFGFSNNHVPKFGPPSFKGASFEINAPRVEQSITLQSF